jgi:lipoyl(octanoyl) transferase
MQSTGVRSTSEARCSRSLKLCRAVILGRRSYGEALALQMEICDLKKRDWADDVLLLLEHPPTITLGRNGRWQHLVASDTVLAERGVERWEVDRGGDITFHGPGQLVGYPILKLEGAERDVHRFMRNMEEALLLTLSGYGITAERRQKLTGVWTASGKIAALGVHISRWITRHGFALNVSTDLSYFDLIIPCGIVGAGVTSMSNLLEKELDLLEVAQAYTCRFGDVFSREMVWTREAELRREMAEANDWLSANRPAATLEGRGCR